MLGLKARASAENCYPRHSSYQLHLLAWGLRVSLLHLAMDEHVAWQRLFGLDHLQRQGENFADRGVDPDGRCSSWSEQHNEKTLGQGTMTGRNTSFQFLGQFVMTIENGEVELSSKKLRALLAFLTLQKGTHQPRERLMELLWGSHFEAQARQNLRQALSRLRKLIGNALVVSGDDRVGLDLELLETDVSKFESLCSDGSREALEQADELYGGELLDGLTLSEAAWEDWIGFERSRLSELAIEARTNLAAQLLDSSEFQPALAVARRAAEIDPFREDAHRYMMRALAGLGRRPEALRCFDQLSASLEKELGTSPDVETVRVRDAIRDLPKTNGEAEVGDAKAGYPASPMPSTLVAPSASSGAAQGGETVESPASFVLAVDSQQNELTDSNAATKRSFKNALDIQSWRKLSLRELCGVVFGCVAIIFLGVTLASTSFFSQQNQIPALFGTKLALVKNDQHKSVLSGARIDLRDIHNGEPVTIWVNGDGQLRLEAIQISTLRQKLQTDTGTWRSSNNQFCMTFGWYFGGTEFCAWIARDGVTHSAIHPKNERTLNWVINDGAAAQAKRLVPTADQAGKVLSNKDIASILPGTELHFGYRGQPIVMKLLAGGQLDIEVLNWEGPKGRHYETDHGMWSVNQNKLCLKPGWWQDGRETCFGVRAASFAYALLRESGQPTTILVRR